MRIPPCTTVDEVEGVLPSVVTYSVQPAVAVLMVMVTDPAKELPLGVNVGVAICSSTLKTSVVTGLLKKPGAMVMALMVVVERRVSSTMALEYTGDDAVGVLPSVVKCTTAPGVTEARVTDALVM